MSDLLEHIASHEEPIIQQWSQGIRNLSSPVYKRLDDETLAAAVRRSYQALLHLMQSGNPDEMEQSLRQSAQSRIENGASYGETVAVWLIYRQAVQAALRDVLQNADDWDQLVDRVDAALDWVFSILQDVYQQAGQ